MSLCVHCSFIAQIVLRFLSLFDWLSITINGGDIYKGGKKTKQNKENVYANVFFCWRQRYKLKAVSHGFLIQLLYFVFSPLRKKCFFLCPSSSVTIWDDGSCRIHPVRYIPLSMSTLVQYSEFSFQYQRVSIIISPIISNKNVEFCMSKTGKRPTNVASAVPPLFTGRWRG